MVYFILTREHRYTLKAFLKRKSGAKIGILTYNQLFASRKLNAGTYIFSDLERLMPWELHLAAQIAQELISSRAGFKVLNHPAHAKTRVELLRSLYLAGINQFNVYRADEIVFPERYPVFIRWENDHGLPLSGLIDSEDKLRNQLDVLRNDGYPMNGLIITEYMAQPVRENVYRKLASYRIGDQIKANHYVSDDQWNVKYGKEDFATAEDYQSECRFVAENLYEAELKEVFDIANIQYGRADFGIVDGRIQVYEINTNPKIPLNKKHTPQREKTMKLAQDYLFNALDALDSDSSRPKKYRLKGAAKSLYRLPRRYRLLAGRRRQRP